MGRCRLALWSIRASATLPCGYSWRRVAAQSTNPEEFADFNPISWALLKCLSMSFATGSAGSLRNPLVSSRLRSCCRSPPPNATGGRKMADCKFPGHPKYAEGTTSFRSRPIMWMRWNGCLKILPSLRLGVVPMPVVKGLAFGRLSTSGSTSTV